MATFNKTTSFPTFAYVRVTAPLDFTAWDFTLQCIDPPNPSPNLCINFIGESFPPGGYSCTLTPAGTFNGKPYWAITSANCFGDYGFIFWNSTLNRWEHRSALNISSTLYNYIDPTQGGAQNPSFPTLPTFWPPTGEDTWMHVASPVYIYSSGLCLRN
jgi:hypothetical protein